MAPTLEHLVESCVRICMRTTPLPEENAVEFLADFSLDFVFTAFQSASLDGSELQTVTQALSKVFAAVDVASLLPKLLEYATLALESSDVSIKQLAVEQLTRLSHHADTADVAVDALFESLKDAETRVGFAASNGLAAFFGRDSLGATRLEQHAAAVTELLSHGDAVLRMRGLELCLRLSLASAELRVAVQQAGFVEVGMRQLVDFGDVLGCLACWELFAELLGKAQKDRDGESASVLGAWIQPKIPEVLSAVPSMDRTLAVGIVKVLSAIVGQTAPDGESFVQLAALLQEILDQSPSDLEWADVVLDCFGQLGRTSVGAEKFVLDTIALSELVERAADGQTTPALRITALQSLETITRSASPSQLCPPAEARLQALFCQSHGAGGSLMEALQGAVSNASMELRAAVYGLMSSLLLRPWYVARLCQDDDLLDRLTDPKGEVHAELSKARYACLEAAVCTVRSVTSGALSASPEHQTLLQSKLPVLQEALQQGPFGRGIAISSVPVVGTEHR